MDREETMRRILNQRVSEEEKMRLWEDGFRLPRATKETLLLVALYKKASGGDLSAIREILSMGKRDPVENDGVVLIDDVPDPSA